MDRKKFPDDYMSDNQKNRIGIGCPKCGCRRTSRTTNSTPYENNQRKRRKVCAYCGRVYYTYESLKQKGIN